MDRSDPTALLDRLKEAGVWSKKALGQHFLLDLSVLESMGQAAGLGAADTVLEIGPGMGVLSEFLLPRVQKLIAFEMDPDMVGILRTDVPGLEIVEGDVLRTAQEVVSKLQDDGVGYKVVANIPYQITSPLLALFLEGGVSQLPLSLTLLVQKEVGKRLAAKEGKPDRSYLSVLAQYCAEVAYIRDVPSESFWPAPKVDSGVIHLAVRQQRALPPEQERAFMRFVRMRFTQQRKQFKNVLAGIRGITSAEAATYLTGLGLPENVRAQELSLERWLQLFQDQF